MQHERYIAMNAKYLTEGEELLARGDHPQAAEKFWGAVAQAVKAVAELRGWRHSSHRDLRGAVGRLYQETGDEDLPTLFSVAEALHANFYEDFIDPESMRLYAEQARRLIEKLHRLAG